MLRLPPFKLFQPQSLGDAVQLLQQHRESVRILAGGTDVLANLKVGRDPALVLVSLSRVPALRGVRVVGNHIHIGSMTPLSTVAEDKDIVRHLPALAAAAAAVGSPQIRRQGTLGGNVCLDTRCRYVNQSALFRQALGGCLKSQGSACHVVPGGQSCVAALSSDTLPALIAYAASVQIQNPDRDYTIPVQALRSTDGVQPLRIAASDILTGFQIPIPAPTTRCHFVKWAERQAIDFPLISLTLRLDMQDPQSNVIASGRIIIGALGPLPKIISLDRFAGATLEQLAGQIGATVFAVARPLPNLPYDPAYRRDRLAIEARRAVHVLTRGWIA